MSRIEYYSKQVLKWFFVLIIAGTLTSSALLLYYETRSNDCHEISANELSSAERKPWDPNVINAIKLKEQERCDPIDTRRNSAMKSTFGLLVLLAFVFGGLYSFMKATRERDEERQRQQQVRAEIQAEMTSV